MVGVILLVGVVVGSGVGVGVSVLVGVVVGSGVCVLVGVVVGSGVPVGVSVTVGVGVFVVVLVGVTEGTLIIVITNVLVFPPEPQLQVYTPGVNPIPVIVAPAYVVEPLMNEPDVYPVGTNKFLFVAFGNIPNVSPESDGVPIGPPAPKLGWNVVTPVYMSTVIGDADPTTQIACAARNPAPITSVPSGVNAVVLKLPEPDQTTSGPTCETVTLKLPVAADVGVGVGVAVLVGVTDGVPVEVSVTVGVGVSVGVVVGSGVGVSVGVPVGVVVLVGVVVGSGVGVAVLVTVGV
jgi:hypothetical protein